MPGTQAESKPSKEAEKRVGQEQVRRTLPDIADQARDGQRFIVTNHERDRFVILGMKDYERFLALEQSAA